MKWTAAAAMFLLPVALPAAETFPLKQGDHISFLGNTLADRMQHSGWLETLLHARFPKHDLSFRNLGFSGDELAHRIRSAAFGSPDHWLAHCKTDAVFAFFGYNESYAGAAGLDKFKRDLNTFVQQTLGQKYNGNTAPRIVLFSPIAHEDLKNPNLPDGKANNARLKLYTEAMAEVAAAHKIFFVDLFNPTLARQGKTDRPLTFNGVHLNDDGDRVVAELIDRALFGPSEKQLKPDYLEKLRAAIHDKNFHWFQRYRTTDGYSIYGGRADLRFQPDNQSNRVVMQREMEILDVLTANRDKLIWAAAQGEDIKVDDGNTPEFIPVKTNKPGPLAGGKHLFLDGDDAIKKMTVGKNMKVSLFASEKQFKELINPVQMSFDTKGRLWVAAWPTYPHWKPKGPMNDKLLILEDTDGDGRADKCTTFADGLHNPTGFEFWNGGVIVAQAPDLVFLKDTNGDDKADVRERVLHGLCSADTHHTANSFTLDPGGALYFQEGTFHHTQVETPWGPSVRCANAGVFRYEPRSHKFDVYVSFGFANPHGHVFDRWGQDIVVDGTGAQPYHAALFSGHMNFPQKHAGPPQVFRQQSRPCPGMEYMSSRHFPDEMQGDLLVANVITFHGIFRYKIKDDGSSFTGDNAEHILSSSDPNFRPSDLKIGPDGAIWFTDWHNPIIGHMQHNLRDPSRNKDHGRVYRVTYQGRDLLTPPKIAGESVEKLLDLLKSPEDRVRYRTRIELGGRKASDVLPAAQKWLDNLDKKDANYEHHRLEVLWLHQNLNVVNLDLLKEVLASKDFRARSAAARVLCYWRDRIPEALEMFRTLAADAHPRVRLEAVRAASFFTVPEAVEIPIIAAELPTDRYLEFTRGETLKTIEPILKDALAKGKSVAFTSDAGARYLLRNLNLEQLLKMERTRAVSVELLHRPGVRDEVRREALRSLAKHDKKAELRVLLDLVSRIDEKKDNRDESVLFDLIRQLNGRPAAELADVRGDLEKIALTSQQPVIRQIGFVALVNIDGDVEKAWKLATKSVPALRDLVQAMPLIADPGLRASLYPKVEPLLKGLPENLASGITSGKSVKGRFVRIELPGQQRTLTLAEVEVFSEGQNVARKGKATQKNTAHGGGPEKAIDGNKSGTYADGGQTHSQEGTNDPWWEVDLGAEFPIESVVIWNRTDGNLGTRLKDFTVKVLDGKRNAVFNREKVPTPEKNVAFEVGSESAEQVVRRLAMLSLTSVRGQETKTFQTVAKYVKDASSRIDAVRALQRIPKPFWPKEEALTLIDTLLAHVRKIPTKERTTPAALDALEFADSLASLLPADEAKKIRAELGELGVRVIRIGTLPERMAYDKEIIVVKAGKPVEFLFENYDLMPHNLAIVQPGALEEIGTMAEATAQQPDAAARHFIPRSNKILLGSQLLQPREIQKLSFNAPAQPGIYPIVCTYPGHWRRMYAALYVVEDLDAYLANPDLYLMRHPLVAKDELLKDRRPRTEWKFEDLSVTVESMKAGRSYAHGKQMFTVATCIACHKLDNVGNEFGPDLLKLDPKYMQADILKELIDPSAKINEKYQSWIFELKSGKSVTGLILEETPDAVKVIENPLASIAARVIKKSEIDTRTKSPVSMMPKGLLDKLTRDEILDLIAYLTARGKKDHDLFKGDHDRHGGGHHH